MNPRWIAVFKILAVLIAVAILIALFPPALRFVEMAARDLLYFWWVIFLLALAIWLIWGLGSKKK
jgi:hypothetical protein